MLTPRRWTIAFTRLFVYALVAVQIAQSAFRAPTEFAQSYWLIDYGHGFVRRGLAGELTNLMSGLGYSRAILMAGWFVALAALASVLVLIEVLIRRQTTASVALAVLIAASPFTVDQIVYHRRPDVVGIALLIAAGFAGTARRRGRLWLSLVGLAFGAAAFAHEAVVLMYLPAATALVVIVGMSKRDRADYAGAVLLALPAGAAFLTIVLRGRAEAGQIDEMKRDAPLQIDLALFDYLDDSAADSINFVIGQPVLVSLLGLSAGVVLTTAHVLWVRCFTRVRVFSAADRVLPYWLAVTVSAVVGTAVLLTFMTGTDWTRWFCIFGSVYMVVASFLLISDDGDDDGVPMLPPWILPVAAYSTLILPLPEILDLSKTVRSFLFV